VVSWEHLAEWAMQPLLRRQLKDKRQLARFFAINRRYAELYARLARHEGRQERDFQGEDARIEGYDWARWGNEIARSFREGVPLGFLGHPTLARTMVFGRRRGIRSTQVRLRAVVEALGPGMTAGLVREDYVGLPTITTARYLTSANRSHHASHLAYYAQMRGKRFWECESVVEWGGGYGNMARLIRRMNPAVTYVIVDLPALLALQQVYLSSVEGEDAVHVVSPEGRVDIEPGKINLVAWDAVMLSRTLLACESFLSTWALTESPRACQLYVRDTGFFGARRVLLAWMCDRSNHLTGTLRGDAWRSMAVPMSGDVGTGNEYWFL
jgi:hypothetical protein